MDWKTFCHDRDWVVLFHKKFNMKDFQLKYSSEFDRKVCPLTDDGMEDFWCKLCEQNNRLYNASKFRLDSVDKDCVVNVGLTDYKASMCTNQSSSKNDIFEYGVKEFQNGQACFSDPIAVNCVIITSDGFVVLIKRAQWVSEAKGMVDTPGGHSEPEEALKKHELNENDVRSLTGEQVKYEIFHSMVREIRDELNIPEDRIQWPDLLGIIRNKSLGYKPCFIFQTSCDITKAEVEELYAKGGPETDESTGLVFIPFKDLQNQASEIWKNVVEKMAPCGQAALYLSCYL